METILEMPEVSLEGAHKIVQQQLVLILHAHNCQQRDLAQASSSDSSSDSEQEDLPNHRKQCTLPFCERTKLALNHIRGCYEPDACLLPHCHATRQIIRHWKSCQIKTKCSICRPIFKAQIKNIKS